jgi:NTE family protein
MYNGLIFEGGGMKALAYVGALEVMYKYQDIYAMQYFGGTSVGSILATLLACSHSLKEINDIMYAIDWNKLNDGNFGCFRLFWNCGHHKGKYFEDLINTILYKRFGMHNMTFKQLYTNTKKHLRMVGTNITKGKTVYMDHIFTPQMSVAQGVRISACNPLSFKPVEIDNEVYIDSCFIKTLDLQMFEEYNIECVAFDLKEDFNMQNQSKKYISKNILVYTNRIINMLHEKANRNTTMNSSTSVCVINENKLDFMKFKLTKLEKQYLKKVGMYEMTKYIYKL